MKKLPLAEVGAGEVVARPVVTGSGVVLVQPGTRLTAEVLARLAALRVETLCVEGASPDAKPLDELLANLDRRFTGHEDNELMMELKAIVAGRLAQGATEHRD